MANRKRLKLIAFDLGGVLLEVNKAKHPQSFFAPDLFEPFMRGHLSEEHYIATVAKRLGLGEDECELHFRAMIQVHPSCDALLTSLSLPYTIWSNINALHYKEAMKQSARLKTHKDTLSFELGLLKPDTSFYKAALAKAGVSPGEVLYFDDKSENIESAIAMGINAVRVSSPFECRKVCLGWDRALHNEPTH